MTIEETRTLIDKIKIYRPSFGGQFDKAGMDKLKLEWFRILEPYDYKDVDNKLNEYFKDGDNFGRYPDVYYLTRYLKTIEEKKENKIYSCRCNLCNELISLQDYEVHYDRCSSIEYLCRMSEKYFFKKVSKEKLWELSDKEFEKKYWLFCEELLKIMEDGLQKHCLKNAILTREGLEPEYEMAEIGEKLKDEIK